MFDKRLIAAILVLTGVVACSNTDNSSDPVPGYNPLADFEQLDPATIFATPEPQFENSSYTPGQLSRGRYLVGLLGCGSCHTDGSLTGAPDPNRLLAGSGTGIAYTSPFVDSNPGVVYPPNLTPDMETGLGSWTMERLVTMIRVGTTEHSTRSLPVMPWPAYASITREDALAIAAYLKSLTPVSHRVPRNVNPGATAPAPYVHFGVYQRLP
ncbi:MAG: c-type cytochrome [Pseudohongiellaceae bacterium]